MIDVPRELPPLPRKNTVAKYPTPRTSTGISNQREWKFNDIQLKRFQAMGLSRGDVNRITKGIGSCPGNFDLVGYITSARLAGVPATSFPLIADSGALSNLPDITQLRRYVNALPGQPLLAMLAMRAGLAPTELKRMKEDEELTVENLRAMIDISSI